MFLFHKRTKKVIKWFWGVFATIVILSMVFTYSGFTMLARSPSSETDIPPEILAELEAQRSSTSSPDTDMLLEQASNTVRVATPTIERVETTPTPAPDLQFGI